MDDETQDPRTKIMDSPSEAEQSRASALVFSLTRKEVDVELDGAAYKLIEMSGKQRNDHQCELSAKFKYDTNGKVVGFKDQKDINYLLLKYTLYKMEGNTAKLATMLFIGSLPNSVILKLTEEARRLCGLDKEEAKAETEAKNDSEEKD